MPITGAQLRAARALLEIDQHRLSDMTGLSVGTIHRMEASQGRIHGTIESLMKLLEALNASGIELISENASSADGGRGVRLKGKVRVS